MSEMTVAEALSRFADNDTEVLIMSGEVASFGKYFYSVISRFNDCQVGSLTWYPGNRLTICLQEGGDDVGV